jgi:hypothetical protein
MLSWNIHFGTVDDTGVRAMLHLCQQQGAAIVGLQEVSTATRHSLLRISSEFGYRVQACRGPLFGSQSKYRNVLLFDVSFQPDPSDPPAGADQRVPDSNSNLVADPPLGQTPTDDCTYPCAVITGWWSDQQVPLRVTTFHVPCAKREIRRAETQQLAQPRSRSRVHVVLGDANWHCASGAEQAEWQTTLRRHRGSLLLPTQSTTLNALAGQTRQPADLALLWSSLDWRCANWQTEILWLRQLNSVHPRLKQTFGCTDHQPVCFRVQLLPSRV